MSSLHDLEKQLQSLSRGEKAQLLQWVARDLGDSFPGVENTPGICGGEPCIVRTRIPVWVLEQSRRPPAELSDTLGGGSRRFVLPKRCFVMTNLVPGSVWGKPRSSIAKTCMRSSGRGVACGFQAKANGSQAQKVRLGARRGGVLC